MKETTQQALARFKQLELVQKEYPTFRPFLEDGMRLLGFSASDMQCDIGAFMEYGPDYLMVQAQREEAKTTIAALFAVWTLIHTPRHRILIVSCGEDQSNQISTLIKQIIMSWDILEMLRPDPSAGDRTSVEAFDVHHSLKGLDKSPSVACKGIFSDKTGNRADLIIADDVESPKNSETAGMREKLLQSTREFSSICGKGRILYLGTPQSNESIYNSLPARGYTVRIWPGRFPTPEQREGYAERLAPYIARRLDDDPSLATGGGLLGDQGQPTDPLLKDEDTLRNKELDQGTAHFQLQFMLNTALSDKQRYPLKTSNLIYANIALDKDNPQRDTFPMTVMRDPRATALQDVMSGTYAFKMGQAVQFGEFRPLQSKIMYVDPSLGGKNADETGYMVIGFLNGNVFLIEAGGMQGGFSVPALEALADIAARHKPNLIQLEKNGAYGAFTQLWLPILHAKYKCNVEDVMVRGQKEKRIISILEPVMGRGSLVVLENAIRSNEKQLARYEAAKRRSYDLFFQMNHITLMKDCLEHDDRVDALAGAVNYFVAQMAIDQQKKIEAEEAQKFKDWQKDPLGHKAFQSISGSPRRGPNLLSKYRKR